MQRQAYLESCIIFLQDLQFGSEACSSGIGLNQLTVTFRLQGAQSVIGDLNLVKVILELLLKLLHKSAVLLASVIKICHPLLGDLDLLN